VDIPQLDYPRTDEEPMTRCVECNLCDRPGSLAQAAEVNRVPCNVRTFRDDRFTMWRCTNCGSLHCAEDADLAHYYADYPLKQQRMTFHERVGYGNRLRLLEQQGFQRHEPLLDYGCGVGLFLDFLRDSGCPAVSGYDVFVPRHADPAVLHRTYSAVVSYDVIEHDDDPRAFMRTVAGLVRPGGLLVIGTPNADHVSLRRIHSPSLHPPYHRHILSERALLALGRDAGLEPVQMYRRSFYDSLYPTVNSRFMWRYVERSGGMLDAVTEPPRQGVVLHSPEMLFWAFFGWLFPQRDNIIVTFRKAPVRIDAAKNGPLDARQRVPLCP
jgi:2-polyprenyl-3-methyl-5-hydroxy-6-metoxy-1,4-benzoquinol methylase